MLTLKHRPVCCCRVVHNTTSGTELLSMLGIGDYNSIINAIEKAEMAANQSREAADEALKVTHGPSNMLDDHPNV